MAVGCKNCIDKWINGKNKCPHCRSILQSKQLIPFRFMDDLVSQLSESLEREKKPLHDEYCAVHNELMIYYCKDCDDGVCSDCIAFEETHRDHTLERIQSLYSRCLEQMKDNMVKLDEKSSNYKSMIEFANTAVQTIMKKGQDAVNTQKMIFKESERQIRLKAKELIAPFQVCESKIKSESEKLGNTIKVLETKISGSSPLHIIKNSETIISLINRHPTLNYEPQIPKLDIDFHTDLIPPYERREFTIFDYSSLSYCFSPAFSISGLDWRVNFRVDDEILTAFVELLTEREYEAEYQFYLEMKYGDPEISAISNEVTYLFDKQSKYTYVEIAEVTDIDKMFENSSKVVIIFNVRSTSWKQKCIDLENSIQNCKSEVNQMPESSSKFTSKRKLKSLYSGKSMPPLVHLSTESREAALTLPGPHSEELLSSMDSTDNAPVNYNQTPDVFDEHAQSFSNTLLNTNPLFGSPTVQRTMTYRSSNCTSDSFHSPIASSPDMPDGYLDDLYSTLREEEDGLNLGDIEDDFSEDSENQPSTTYLDTVLDTLDTLQYSTSSDNGALMQRLKTNVIEMLARYTSIGGINNEDDDETVSNYSVNLTEL
ncbi:Tripartite motif containing 37 [Terramyces sp. JEL0728]|nr:Tripartite motif containing 37 [Terramyces sp. JEL0728]